MAADGSGCNDWYLDPIPTHDVSGNPIPGQAIGRLVFDGCSSCPKAQGGATAMRTEVTTTLDSIST